MKYKAIQEKVQEIAPNHKVVGVKKEDLIAFLNENNISVEGEKFGYIHDNNEQVNEEQDLVFKSISAHIRYLFDEGMKQSAIAKQLQVRDQFVSNVVRKYKESKKESSEEVEVLE